MSRVPLNAKKTSVGLGVLSLLAALAPLDGCRQFDVCGAPGEACRSQPGAAGDGAAAGEGGASPVASDAGAAGRASGVECSEPFNDCDGTTLNGCETNTLKSHAHCGACGASCEGTCSRGECSPFEFMVSDREYLGGSVVFTEDHAFFASKTKLGDDLRIERMRLADRSVETLLATSEWDSVDALAATSTRLYIAVDSRLWSFPLHGGELRDEGLDAETIAAIGSTLLIVHGGNVFLRAGDVAHPVQVDGIEGAERAAAGDTAFAVSAIAGYTPDLGYSHELYVFGPSDVPVRMSDGPGEITALELDDSTTRRVHFAVAGPGSESVTLYEVEESGFPVPLFPLADVTRFIVTERGVLASYEQEAERGGQRGLRFYPFAENRAALDWPLALAPQGLSYGDESDTGELVWFFEPYTWSLVRTRLDEMLRPFGF